jgi:hypothetical protein
MKARELRDKLVQLSEEDLEKEVILAGDICFDNIDHVLVRDEIILCDDHYKDQCS